MYQSRRQVRPRSSRLYHSASFCATKPNKASMTLMLAAASICTTDALERHLAPPGFNTRPSGRLKTSILRPAQISPKIGSREIFSDPEKKSRGRDNFLRFDALGRCPCGVPAAECRVARPPTGDLFSFCGAFSCRQSCSLF